MQIYRSKVKATPEEIEELKQLAQDADRTPVIAFGSQHALQGGAAGDARRRMSRRCHAVALSHGLPEQPGFYGCDLKTGEFVSTRPITEPEGDDA